MTNPIKAPTTLEDLSKWYRTYFPYCMIGTITAHDLADEHMFLSIGFSDIDDPWQYSSNLMLAEYLNFMKDYAKAKQMFAPLEDSWYVY